MIVHKKNPKKQLEKYSVIFMQIGLILVLFITYVLVESKTEVKKLAINPDNQPIEITFTPVYDVYEIEKVKTEVVKKQPPKQIFFDDPKVVDNDAKTSETLIPDSIETPKFNIDDVITVDEEEDVWDVDDPKVYDARMFTPTFKGCEGLVGDKNRECFESKLRKFVQKRFNTDAGLNEGTYKVYSQFVINKEGYVVDIKIKAPTVGLEKEMRRVINKLPKFIPGMQGDIPVNVKYILPLAFKVD